MVKTASGDFYAFARFFYCGIDPSVAKYFVMESHFVFLSGERLFLFQNIVGAEYIVCTH